MSEDVIAYEELQDFQELEGIDSKAIQVAFPNGLIRPYVKLIFRFRRLGPSPLGTELTTRENIVVRPEFAKAVVDRMAEQIDLAERLGSSK